VEAAAGLAAAVVVAAFGSDVGRVGDFFPQEPPHSSTTLALGI